MLVEVTLAQVVVAGAAGALAMSVTSFLFNLIRVPMVDLGRLIATKLLRYHSHGTRLGLVLHVLSGVVLALVYALFFVHFLPGGYWVRGISYGAILWLAMMLAVLPLLGDGFFGWRAARSMAPSALAVHLLYGLILGFALRGP